MLYTQDDRFTPPPGGRPAVLSREQYEKLEADRLAPYAMKSASSRGRRHPEAEHPVRSAYQRDRDRIIHCAAFRRLEYKTQVFVNHEGDYYRTRLTHTLEVTQITRTIARTLRLNEDLAETIALAHDLGHTPFGHSGETIMNDLMADHGGFEHNRQSLRVIEELETRYPDFPGLNLTYEVREGIAKHSSEYDQSQAEGYDPMTLSTLEARIVDVADEIAYNNHDIDDGLTSDMIDPEALEAVTLWREHFARIRQRWPSQPFSLWKHQTVRHIINAQVTDLVSTVHQRLGDAQIDSVEQARDPRHADLVSFSADMSKKNRELKDFLMAHLYQHSRVIRMEAKARRILTDLFTAYTENPRQLPPSSYAAIAETWEENQRLDKELPDDLTGEARATALRANPIHRENEGRIKRAICDYIAGMTDRFAIDEHKKLFDPHERV
ncbi:MAG: deoxyguanosinetriphosphate triphosphohydrolase [bacterium]|nr:deoxyguanosinetriphosphate triphosphohydrolase [bacterium]